MLPRHRRPLLTFVSCLVLLGMPKASHAIEWVANPSLQAGYEYNDNISLVTSAPRSVSGTTLTANLDLGARQEGRISNPFNGV